MRKGTALIRSIMPKKPTLPATVQVRVPIELIERKIYLIRSQKVMLDSDLAELYEAPTKVFNQAVKRNLNRFPADFMFRLTRDELNRSQFVTVPRSIEIHVIRRTRLQSTVWPCSHRCS